jgi:glyoxylase-like metal-dependent hydrolase (beta-lactamase superfamily II)
LPNADGTWAPTFPNARYLIPAADDFHLGPQNSYGGGTQQVERLIYEDSVAPVHQAGLVELWDGGHRIDEHLTLESAPGHTPGSSILRLASGSDPTAARHRLVRGCGWPSSRASSGGRTATDWCYEG